MSFVDGLINAAAQIPGLTHAFNFGKMVLPEKTVTATVGSGTCTFNNYQSFDPDGVVLSSTDTASLSANFPWGDEQHFIFIVEPTATTFRLMNLNTSRFAYIECNNSYFRMFYDSQWNGEQISISNTETINLNQRQMLAVGFPNKIGSWPASIQIAEPPNILKRDDSTVSGGIYDNLGSPNQILFGSGFNGIVSAFLAFSRQLTNAELQSLVAELGAIGAITVPSNLSSERTQSGIAFTEDLTIDGTFVVPESTSDINYNSPSMAGTLLQFFAFDSNDQRTVLKTEYIDPTTVSPFQFDSLTGGISPASQSSKVSGVVQIDGTPAERQVRAFGYNPIAHAIDGTTVSQSKSLGQSTSDPETGEYTIDLLAGYGQEIFVVAFDDYGDAFTAEQALTVGDRIHPTTPNGHVWETTGAGTLLAEEPIWVVDTETSQLYGTASMIARPFYRPMVHGPVTPEVTGMALLGVPLSDTWRLFIYSSNGDPRVAVCEWELYNLSGGRVQIGSESASSQYAAIYAVDLANDGDQETLWLATSNADEWLRFSAPAGGPVKLGSMKIRAGGGSNGSELAPLEFALEYIDPNTNDFVEHRRWTETNWQTLEIRTFNLE